MNNLINPQRADVLTDHVLNHRRANNRPFELLHVLTHEDPQDLSHVGLYQYLRYASSMICRQPAQVMQKLEQHLVRNLLGEDSVGDFHAQVAATDPR